MPHSLLGLLLVFLFCPRTNGQTSSLPLCPDYLMSPLPAEILPRFRQLPPNRSCRTCRLTKRGGDVISGRVAH